MDAHSLRAALLVAAALLAGGEPSYGDELSPRSAVSAHSAGCRRCCQTSRGDFSDRLTDHVMSLTSEPSECAQAYKGKPGICVRHDRDLCCPSATAHFHEDSENCSFEPFTPCVRDTGGSCTYFSCSSLREAAQCVGGRCLCQPGYCSVNGICVSNCSLNAGRAADAEPAPTSKCYWSHFFLDYIGYGERACSWFFNNYGRAVCYIDDQDYRDGACFPDNREDGGEQACWLGAATKNSIEKFAYKCERDTGRAFPGLGCFNSWPFSCPGNATCDASRRCMCAASECSINGNCAAIKMDYMPEQVQHLGSSTLNSPISWIVLVCVCLSCCCILSRTETLELAAHLEKDTGEELRVTIDLGQWEVEFQVEKDGRQREGIFDLTLTDKEVLTITLVNSKEMVVCKKSENETRWPDVEKMCETYQIKAQD